MMATAAAAWHIALLPNKKVFMEQKIKSWAPWFWFGPTSTPQCTVRCAENEWACKPAVATSLSLLSCHNLVSPLSAIWAFLLKLKLLRVLFNCLRISEGSFVHETMWKGKKKIIIMQLNNLCFGDTRFFFNSSVVWAAEVTQPIVTAFLEQANHGTYPKGKTLHLYSGHRLAPWVFTGTFAVVVKCSL